MSSKVKGIPCPACGKKTLYHPSAWGGRRSWLKHYEANCRSCGAKFEDKRDMKDALQPLKWEPIR